MADVLATAYAGSTATQRSRLVDDTVEYYNSSHFTDELRSTLRTMLERDPEKPKNVDKWLKRIEKCLENRDYITVCRLDRSNITKDMISGMLHALYKVNTNEERVRGVLKLTLLWNRIDLAEQYVFARDKRWPNGFFNDIAYEAVVNDRADFLRVLLRHHLSMKSFLGIHELIRLYNDIPEDSLALTLLQHLVMAKDKKSHKTMSSSKKVCLHHVGLLIARLFGDGIAHPYSDPRERYCWIDTELLFAYAKESEFGVTEVRVASDEEPERKRYMEVLDKSGFRRLTLYSSSNLGNDERRLVQHFDDPALDLFVYCILLCRTEMALVLFEWLSEPIAAALAAKKILQVNLFNS